MVFIKIEFPESQISRLCAIRKPDRILRTPKRARIWTRFVLHNPRGRYFWILLRGLLLQMFRRRICCVPRTIIVSSRNFRFTHHRVLRSRVFVILRSSRTPTAAAATSFVCFVASEEGARVSASNSSISAGGGIGFRRPISPVYGPGATADAAKSVAN